MSEPISLETEVERDDADDETTEDGEEDGGEEEAADDEVAPPEAEAPPAPTDTTPEQWDARFKKADKSFEGYMKRITALWEEDAVHLLPFTLGAMAPPGFIDTREAGRVPDDIRDTALQFLGYAREQEYEPDPYAQQCVACKGKGKTGLPTTVAGETSRKCTDCGGHGYLINGAPVSHPATNGSTDEPFTLAQPSSAPAPERDNWMEPRILPDGRENPNYGKQPQFKVQVEPWGVTAGLGAQDAAA